MSYYKKALKNIFTNWACLGINLVISFFLAPFVVHKLGSTYYGIWVIMMQLTGYLYLLDFGVRESVVRYVSKYHAKEEFEFLNQIINSAVILYSGISLICLVVAVGLAILFPFIFNVSNEVIPTARLVVLITGVNIAQLFVFNVFTGILMGLQRYDIFNKTEIIFAFVRLFLIVYLLNQGFGIIALGSIQLFVNISSNIIIYFISRKMLIFKFKLTGFAEQRSIYKKIISYSFFVFLGNICQKIIFYTDAIVIGIFLPVASITYYAIAGNLIEYLRRLIMSMANVFNPLTSELEAKNEEDKITAVLIQGTKFSLLIGLPICATYFIMGREFIALWMGREYAEAAGAVLAILTVTHLFSLPHYTVSMILYGTSRHQILAYCKSFEAVANICLSLALVKQFGIVGVAIGTAVPHLFVVVFIFPAMITKMVGLKLWKYITSAYLGPFASILPFIAISYYTKIYHPASSLFDFFLKIFLMLPIYFVTAWFFSFTKEEHSWFKRKLVPFIPVLNK